MYDMLIIFKRTTKRLEENETSTSKDRMPFVFLIFLKINYYRYTYLYLATFIIFTLIRTLINA